MEINDLKRKLEEATKEYHRLNEMKVKAQTECDMLQESIHYDLQQYNQTHNTNLASKEDIDKEIETLTSKQIEWEKVFEDAYNAYKQENAQIK